MEHSESEPLSAFVPLHSDASPQGLYFFNRYVPLMLLCVHTMIYLNTEVSSSM